MNYKLKKFENELADDFIRVFGNDSYKFGKVICHHYYTSSYNNFEVYFSSILWYSWRKKILNEVKTPQEYDQTLLARILETAYNDKQIMLLVKYSFLKAYGKSYIDMMKEYE